TDCGISRTDNAAADVSTGLRAGCQTEFRANSKVVWTSLNNDYSVTQFYRGAVYPGAQYYFGGSQDTGVNRGADGQPNGWRNLGGGDGGPVVLDPVDPSHLVISAQNLSLRRSINGGVTFSSGTSGITESSAPFIANLVADPADANTLYFGGETNLWLSRDFAASWSSAIATDSAGNVSSIAVSPLDSDTVMFGTAKGFVFRTSNATQASITWTSVQLRS